jgi:hypothetical protein
MNEIVKQRNQSYLFLILTLSHILYVLIIGQSTMFYVVYIFWWEEALKYLSEVLFCRFYKHKIQSYKAFDNLILPRLCILIVHFWFIISLFGKGVPEILNFGLELKHNTNIINFEDPYFNSILLLIVIKTSWFWYRQFLLAKKAESIDFNYSENGIWILHISVLMGFFFLFAFSTTIKESSNPTLFYLILILPYLIMKIIVEVININYRFRINLKSEQNKIGSRTFMLKTQ